MSAIGLADVLECGKRAWTRRWTAGQRPASWTGGGRDHKSGARTAPGQPEPHGEEGCGLPGAAFREDGAGCAQEGAARYSDFRWPGGSPSPIFLQVAGGILQRAMPRGIETVPQNLIRLIPA